MMRVIKLEYLTPVSKKHLELCSYIKYIYQVTMRVIKVGYLTKFSKTHF